MEKGDALDRVFFLTIRDEYAKSSPSGERVAAVDTWTKDRLPPGTTFDSAIQFVLHRQNLLRDAMLKTASQPACDGLRVCSSSWPDSYREEMKAEGKPITTCMACSAADEVKEILHGE